MNGFTRAALVGAALTLSCTAVLAQKDTADAIARYRQLLQDGNPAELVAARGDQLSRIAVLQQLAITRNRVGSVLLCQDRRARQRKRSPYQRCPRESIHLLHLPETALRTN